MFGVQLTHDIYEVEDCFDVVFPELLGHDCAGRETRWAETRYEDAKCEGSEGGGSIY